MKLLTLYRALGLKQAIVFVSVLSLIFAFSPFSFNESFADDEESDRRSSDTSTDHDNEESDRRSSDTSTDPEQETERRAELDTIPPVIVVPNDIKIQATSSDPSPVTFSVSATDDVDGNLTPVCSPASGSNFSIGKTKVTCTATDAAGNSASKSCKIIISEPEPECEEPNVLIDGKCTELVSEHEYKGFSVAVDKVDQPYEYGDFVTISGSGAVKSAKIKIKIVSPDGESSTKLSFFSTNDGEFSTIFLIDKDIEHGTYTIIASDSEHKEQTTFFVYTESMSSSGSDYDPEVISHHDEEPKDECEDLEGKEKEECEKEKDECEGLEGEEKEECEEEDDD